MGINISHDGKFNMNENVNIDQYQIPKSFLLYQDIISGEIDQIYIIQSLFTVSIASNRLNILNIILSHFYEYTRYIILNETALNEKLNKSKVIYIGYCITDIILRYYCIVLNGINDINKIDLILLTEFEQMFPPFTNIINNIFVVQKRN